MIFSSVSTLVLIDSAVDQSRWFANHVDPKSDTKVVWLDPLRDGIEQVTTTIAAHPNLTSLHLVSHGRSAELQLGNSRLNLHTLGDYAAQLRQWRKLLVNAELFLYGCQVAAGASGKRFVQQVSQLTQTAIAAATTRIGNPALGGRSTLDFQTGVIRSPLAFSPEAIAAYPGVLTVFLQETFQNADVTVKPWLYGSGVTTPTIPFLTARSTTAPSASGLPGAGGTAIDPVGAGTLRLTNATTDESSFAIYNQPIRQDQGLTITFNLFAYGGTPFNGRNGDGISFFLIDGTANPTTAGAFGGSLGYAQKQVEGIAGLVGGYLGVGFDEFGNYSTSIETQQQRPTPAGVATPVPNAIAVRGSQASQYAFLGGTGSLTTAGNPTTRAASQKKARIDLSPTGVLNVRVDQNNDNDFNDPGEVVISNLNLTQVNGALPATFKLGFAASTGAATNIHEVRNLLVQTLVDPNIPVVDPSLVIGNAGADNDPCKPGRTIRKNSRPNRLRGTRNSDKLIAFAGNDTLQGKGCDDRLDGGRGNDKLFGNGGNDTLKGQQGNDRLSGGRGRDTLSGGLGNDTLGGGNDADRLSGGRGRDTLKGERGADRLDGGRGDDRLIGGVGNDTLIGRQDNDILNGGLGEDTINGGLGRDRLVGGRKRDVLNGGHGDDTLFGGGGGDILNGGQGNDRLVGGTQADRLSGGTEDDVLEGGGGRDRLSGGSGKDRFVYTSAKDRGDRILDFETGRRSSPIDQLDLSRIFAKRGYGSSDRFGKYIRLEQSRRNTIVRVDFNGDAAGGFRPLTTINNTLASNLSANSFVV